MTESVCSVDIGGHVSGVSITSEMGADCEFIDPWASEPSHTPLVWRCGNPRSTEDVRRVNGSKWSFATVRGGCYEMA
jgi:hypothetical protein